RLLTVNEGDSGSRLLDQLMNRNMAMDLGKSYETLHPSHNLQDIENFEAPYLEFNLERRESFTECNRKNSKKTQLLELSKFKLLKVLRTKTQREDKDLLPQENAMGLVERSLLMNNFQQKQKSEIGLKESKSLGYDDNSELMIQAEFQLDRCRISLDPLIKKEYSILKADHVPIFEKKLADVPHFTLVLLFRVQGRAPVVHSSLVTLVPNSMIDQVPSEYVQKKASYVEFACNNSVSLQIYNCMVALDAAGWNTDRRSQSSSIGTSVVTPAKRKKLFAGPAKRISDASRLLSPQSYKSVFEEDPPPRPNYILPKYSPREVLIESLADNEFQLLAQLELAYDDRNLLFDFHGDSTRTNNCSHNKEIPLRWQDMVDQDDRRFFDPYFSLINCGVSLKFNPVKQGYLVSVFLFL
ncbi:hypothetical protein Ciccas_011871, partial [Cichlidogyrus casuarinus]